MGRVIEKRQLSAWTLAAMIAPLATVMAGQPWVSGGITAAACMTLCWTLHRQIQEDALWPAWFCVVQWLWATLALSQILGYLPETWPRAEAPDLIVIVLLLAALWAAWSGTEPCARAGTVMFWIVGALMAGVFAAALQDVRMENLSPRFRNPDTGIFFILLIPCMAVLLPRREKSGPTVLAVSAALLAIAVPGLTAGVLSPKLAESSSNPFYELSRTISFSGAAQCFEALVSAGLTVSWFLLLCLFLAVCGEMAKYVAARWARCGMAVSALGAAVLYLYDLKINETMMAVGGVLLWGLLPVLSQGIGGRKKK